MTLLLSIAALATRIIINSHEFFTNFYYSLI